MTLTKEELREFARKRLVEQYPLATAMNIQKAIDFAGLALLDDIGSNGLFWIRVAEYMKRLNNKPYLKADGNSK